MDEQERQWQQDKEDTATGETAKWRTSARLYALIAPAIRKAVILRRGPSAHVRLIEWDLKRDHFNPGQWLKKRVYERRCDLSPDGRYFIYFAADYKAGYGSWTALSRVPYFTALALWPKGDGWGGGGLFCNNGRKIQLNHRPQPYHHESGEMALAIGFKSPTMAVVPLYDHSGWGEDDPIRYYRMLRDGWTMLRKGSHAKMHGLKAPYGFVQRKATIFAKSPRLHKAKKSWHLRLSSKYTAERQGRWNVEEAGIFDNWGHAILDLGRVDWCDLDHNGDILWAWAGRIWRLEHNRQPSKLVRRSPRLIADFNDMVFENIETPDPARKW